MCSGEENVVADLRMIKEVRFDALIMVIVLSGVQFGLKYVYVHVCVILRSNERVARV